MLVGASTDVRVNVPSVVDCQGIAEFKCPYSKEFDSPERYVKK